MNSRRRIYRNNCRRLSCASRHQRSGRRLCECFHPGRGPRRHRPHSSRPCSRDDRAAAVAIGEAADSGAIAPVAISRGARCGVAVAAVGGTAFAASSAEVIGAGSSTELLAPAAVAEVRNVSMLRPSHPSVPRMRPLGRIETPSAECDLRRPSGPPLWLKSPSGPLRECRPELRWGRRGQRAHCSAHRLWPSPEGRPCRWPSSSEDCFRSCLARPAGSAEACRVARPEACSRPGTLRLEAAGWPTAGEAPAPASRHRGS